MSKGLSENAVSILRKVEKGRSLCFSQDGDVCFLSGQPTEFLKPKDDDDVQALIKGKYIANKPDAEHWTEDNCFDITPAGRAVLARRGAKPT